MSFFVTQDIALNKEKYLTDNFDINLACILGMIRKRPERVVKIIDHYEGQSHKGMKIDVTGFVKKIKLLLLKEKNHIQAPFDTLLEEFKKTPATPKHLFSSILQDPIKKKIDLLKKNIPSKSIDFKGHHFENEHLADLQFSASLLFFSQARFEHCDLSNSYFEKAYFRGTLFHNVNMNATVFDRVNFDNAVFINVSAKKAVFKNCSFLDRKSVV